MSIEQQQKELESKRKAREEAKEHVKKVAGNVQLDLNAHF